MTHTTANLSEKQLVNDAIATEKQLLNLYSTYIAEASCPNLRGELSRILTETQQTQFELFKAMEQKGWYQIQNAELQKVQQAVQKADQLKTEMQ